MDGVTDLPVSLVLCHYNLNRKKKKSNGSQEYIRSPTPIDSQLARLTFNCDYDTLSNLIFFFYISLRIAE